MVAGTMGAVRVLGIEGKLQDDHAREPKLDAQSIDGGGDYAQVLGDECKRPQLALYCVEQRSSRTTLPAAGDRGSVAGGPGPRGAKGTEVDEAGGARPG